MIARPLPPILRRYLIWTVALAALSFLYTAILTLALHPKTPYGLNLVFGADRWWDLLVFHDRFIRFRTPGFWQMVTFPFTYPAPLGLVLGLLYKLPHPLVLYLATCAAALLLWAFWLARSLRANHALLFALTIALTAWPVWFLFATANLEGLVAILLALGVLAVLRRRWYLGAVLIGIAGSMKLYPLILLALLLSQRRLKALAAGLAAAAAFTFIALAALGPTISDAQRAIAPGIRFVKDAFVFSLSPDGYVCNHSLFMPIKMLVARTAHAAPTLDPIARNHTLLETPYQLYLLAAAAFGLAAYFLRIRRLPILNQILALTLCAVILPPISLDYTLLHLLLPFALLCLYAAELHTTEARTLTLHFACFAVIFTVGTFFTVKYRLASPARILALVLLLIASLRRPLPWPTLDSAGEPA